MTVYKDWVEASETYDEIRKPVLGRDLTDSNEAQTRFDVIDRMIREVLGWEHGQISVEEYSDGEKAGYVDYLLRSGDQTIVIEAKRMGSAFPSPSHKTQLKLSGSVLTTGEISKAIEQVIPYAEEKGASVVVVTSGVCWCFFPRADVGSSAYATLLFPFTHPEQAEQLFAALGAYNVENGSLQRITHEPPRREDRLLAAFKYADSRIGRNSIADYIMPALETALYADALLSNPEQLEKCFVTTEARQKFDATLGIYLADPKPITVETAKRIKTGQPHGPLSKLVEEAEPGYPPPVTLIIGPVGAGKSTYLKHFELVSGEEVLREKKAHWIYIDFEVMGKTGDPRKYMYGRLLDYVKGDRGDNTIEYASVIEPAYDVDIRALARGPLAPIYTNKPEFKKKVAEYLQTEFQAVEPYVDKVLRYLAATRLCVVVLDNIDLYEDDALETGVFAEGLALSRRLSCNVVVSVRDKTFVRHRNDSVFNAYELNKFWIDPPPLKSVISSRLTYSKKILQGRSAKIEFANGMVVNVGDLSVFFDIVQRSILGQDAGEYVDAVSDSNIRRGLTLVRNFLTSGHVEADRALKAYLLDDDKHYTFPFHDIYRGTMLGQWRHFREDRAESINLFDSRIGSRNLRLLRLHLLNELWLKAQHDDSLEVSMKSLTELASRLGASEAQVINTMETLAKNGLVRSTTAEEISSDSTVVLSRSGAYYARVLGRRFVYAEECMFDTAIEDSSTWTALFDLTTQIEHMAGDIGVRMELRRDRLRMFLDYLERLEADALGSSKGLDYLASIGDLKASVLEEVDEAVIKAKRRERQKPYERRL